MTTVTCKNWAVTIMTYFETDKEMTLSVSKGLETNPLLNICELEMLTTTSWFRSNQEIILNFTDWKNEY